MLIRRIKTIAMEVLHDLNPNFMKEMFHIKELKYSLINSNIIYQPKFETVTYGKNTFKYYGAHGICYQMKLRRQQMFYLLKV